MNAFRFNSTKQTTDQMHRHDSSAKPAETFSAGWLYLFYCRVSQKHRNMSGKFRKIAP